MSCEHVGEQGEQVCLALTGQVEICCDSHTFCSLLGKQKELEVSLWKQECLDVCVTGQRGGWMFVLLDRGVVGCLCHWTEGWLDVCATGQRACRLQCVLIDPSFFSALISGYI